MQFFPLLLAQTTLCFKFQPPLDPLLTKISPPPLPVPPLSRAATKTTPPSQFLRNLVLPLLLLIPSSSPALASTSTSTAPSSPSYDGFAEYAKTQKMEKSDVSCFFSKCKSETTSLFSSPRGIKGLTCLGRCKGEQSCATQCFAEYGSPSLDNFLSCAIQENECVKVPKAPSSASESENDPGKLRGIKKFDPQTLEGKWYKTDGLNPNYDLFPCQTNTFSSPTKTSADETIVDMGIFFRVQRPDSSKFWENELGERMVVDTNTKTKEDSSPTLRTGGKMYGLDFSENWWIVGESAQDAAVPYKLVAYKGHTLQGGYEGAFVYAKTPVLDQTARKEIGDKFGSVGLEFNDFKKIDNTCPVGDASNDNEKGTGTSTSD